MKKLLAVPALALLLVWLASPGFAQDSKKKDNDTSVRSVQGTVTDADNSAVGGAIVHLKNIKTLQIRSFITKTDGSFAFHGLNTNVDYELKAEKEGAASDSRTLSVFDSRSQAVINLKLNKKQ